ncbi:MAG: hypothetical protein ABR549_18935 [Mycobacteriales bacterium]
MNLDQLLHDTLHDERLALPVPAGTLDAVRRKRRTRQRLAIAGASAGALSLVAVAVVATSALSSSSSTVAPYLGGGVPQGSPAPSITPAFVPQTGRDWLLTPAQWSAFQATHTRPSPPPGQSVVPSPAPLGSMSAELLADVEANALPADTSARREDSVGGQPGTAAVHLQLPGGVPVEVFRSQLSEPTSTEQNGPGTNPDATVVDVPGTTSAAALFPTYGYGFPGISGNAHQVLVVTRGGIATSWVAPGSVPLDQLRTWAFTAAQHAGD